MNVFRCQPMMLTHSHYFNSPSFFDLRVGPFELSISPSFLSIFGLAAERRPSFSHSRLSIPAR